MAMIDVFDEILDRYIEGLQDAQIFNEREIDPDKLELFSSLVDEAINRQTQLTEHEIGQIRYRPKSGELT